MYKQNFKLLIVAYGHSISRIMVFLEMAIKILMEKMQGISLPFEPE
jgi:hypothetical protein